jgi:hypothetical protein
MNLKMKYLMKIRILLPLMLAFILVSGCSSGSYTTYRCPMKCEGEKNYGKAGECPVCHMELEGVDTN